MFKTHARAHAPPTKCRKVLAEPGDAMFWMAAHDETPLCEKCGAEVSGAPNAGVFGLRPSRVVYEKLIARSKKASPWYGERWAYSEQELLSVFFLVEKDDHGSRMVWLDNSFNSFACKYACPPAAGSSAHATPAILHFVGVDKPYTLFVDAPRRSKVINALSKIDVSHSFVQEHVQVQANGVSAGGWARAAGGTEPQLWPLQSLSPRFSMPTHIFFLESTFADS